jgi:DNA repair protein RecO (recombination protein O)
MALVETEALVLRTYNLAEADKIVVCLTREAGLVRGVAKGCRRLKNRFGAALEPFTLITLTYHQKENQELVSIRQTDILKSNFNLLSDPVTLSGLAHVGDLVVEFSPPYQTNDTLFRMVKACIDAIALCPSDLQSILRYFEVWLLRLEGFLPDINRCGECHRSFTETEAVFVSAASMICCQSCVSEDHAQRLPGSVHVQLRATLKLAPGPFAEGLRDAHAKTHRDLANLTQRWIMRVLERQPRNRPSYAVASFESTARNART